MRSKLLKYMLLGDLLSLYPQIYLNVIKSWLNPITTSSAVSSFSSGLCSTAFCPEGFQCRVHFSGREPVTLELQVAATHSSSLSQPGESLKPAQRHGAVFYSRGSRTKYGNKDFSQPRTSGFSWQRKAVYEVPIYLRFSLLIWFLVFFQFCFAFLNFFFWRKVLFCICRPLDSV